MKNETTGVSRRSFIKTGAGISSGLLIGFMVPAYAGRLKKLLGSEPDPGAVIFAPNAFLRIGTDNSVKILLAHAEMGQGIWTTLAMLVAEELDADWKNIKVEHAPPAKEYFHTLWGAQMTGGSSTTYSEFDRYRKAGATARVLLTEAAAKKWKVAAADCKTANGFVTHGNKKLGYGELVATANTLTAPADVPLRTKEQWKYIGKGVKRLDAPDKVNGKAIFGMDVKVKGMKIAVVAHPPVMGGTVKSFDASKAKQVAGVVDVVQIPTGVAVIADNTWAALQGRKALVVNWDLGENVAVNSATQLDDFKKLAAQEGKQVTKGGDAGAAIATAAKTIESDFILPYLAHAAMEPLNCTVKISADKCEIWTGSQMPGMDQAAAAKILGFKPEQVSVTTTFLGGGFGRRATLTSDFVSEAVHIAKASGKTIKMAWTREDDSTGGYYRPSFLHRIKAGIDAAGMPLFWQHIMVGQALPGDDGNGSAEGVSDSPYLKSIPNYTISQHAPKLGITTLWLRSVGHTHTAFAMECMMDELAVLAGKDPVEYRRMLLKDHPRNLGVLNLAAEKAGWGKPLPSGHFHGVAVHESFLSYCAQVAEVSVGEDGFVKVHKITAAIDCGLAVNPDGVNAQIESGVNYALSAALYGAITFKDGVVEQDNFDSYRVLRINESPALIDVHIVDSTDKMGGVGEPGYPPTAPAVANAIFAATGKRMRQCPFGTIKLRG
jgi:isoquinoline 1-oxidoreductase subunit beta